jgi:small subunit ribosomal protein S9
VKTDQLGRYTATGKRKTSVARVILAPGEGRVLCNGRPAEEYFGRPVLVTTAIKPLVASGTLGTYDVIARLAGGGPSGQAGALRHGIARALCVADENLRPELKKEGLLTRDAREKERKKAGLKGARKRPQFSKR